MGNLTRAGVLGLVVAAAVGCTSSSRVSSTTVNVPHDPAATRTWWVIREAGGDDHIVMCDIALMQNRDPRTLCIRVP